MTGGSGLDVQPLTTERLEDLAALFNEGGELALT